MKTSHLEAKEELIDKNSAVELTDFGGEKLWKRITISTSAVREETLGDFKRLSYNVEVGASDGSWVPVCSYVPCEVSSQ